MSRASRQLAAVVGIAAAVLLVAASAMAETCTLELKRLEPISPGQGYTPAQYLFRSTSPQRFYMQMGIDLSRVVGSEGAAEFSKVIKKEPKYVSKHPFRGVAKLGSDEYGFALDALPPSPADKGRTPEAKGDKPDAKAEEKSKTKSGSEPAAPAKDWQPERYGRLYFDLNHNGDLTDDKVIEAEQPKGGLRGLPAGYRQCQFPRIDLTVNAGEAKSEYSFFFSIFSQSSGDFSYVSASLNAGAYREGQITLEGKSRRIVLLDYNSNGRFDDQTTIRDELRGAGGRLYPAQGDVLLIDPDSPQVESSPYGLAPDGGRHQVSKIVRIDGRFCDLKVTPAGDKLTLTPSSVPIGQVGNPAERFRATVYGNKGFLEINGGKSKPAELPEGEWKLLSYTIEHSGAEEPKTPPSEKGEAKPKESSLLRALAKAVIGGSEAVAPVPFRTRNSMVSAQGTGACKPVRVRKGETVEFPFGPPYKPLVKVEYSTGAEARLALSLVGSAGEICSNLMVRGDRPDAPEFTITNPKGDVVEQGRFKYG